jgi:hypothetical protein
MNKEQTAQQLRLAADILETGHPWEVWRSNSLYITPPKFGNPPHYYVGDEDRSEIRLGTLFKNAQL